MDLIVKEVTAVAEKSTQEVEAELLAKHDEEVKALEETTEAEAPQASEEEGQVVDTSGWSDDQIIAEIKKRGIDYNSSKKELPEDVEAFIKYKEETGRGFEDYVNLNRDIDQIDPDVLLRDYLLETEVGLDAEDIDIQMEEDYSFDVDLDEESVINRKTRAKKKDIVKAKEFFAKQKEAYGTPLESRTGSAPQVEAEDLEAYKQYLAEVTTLEQENKVRGDHFLKATETLFGSDFKGFDFTIDDQTIKYSPADASELKEIHSDPSNFAKRFIGEDGLLNDAEGYHKALSVGMNPEKFAKFFYEQGRSSATGDTMKKLKNVDMDTRRTPEVGGKGGFQVRAVGDQSGNRLKVRAPKR